MNSKWPQINSYCIRSSKELREKFLQSEALKKKCCLSESSSEFISFSGTEKKFSNSFGEHVSFATFLTLRKVGVKLFAALILCGFYPGTIGILIKKKVSRIN